MQHWIGQTLPMDVTAEGRAIFAPSETRWHGLMCPPQREEQAEAWLDKRGVYSFHPVTSRTVSIRGKRYARKSRYLPGYVFANFPGAAILHRVFDSPFISDVIRLASGHPATLDRDDLNGIHAMRDLERAQEIALLHAAMIHKGDTVRVMDGKYEVLQLLGGKVTIRMSMFGAERDIDVDVDKVEKVTG